MKNSTVMRSRIFVLHFIILLCLSSSALYASQPSDEEVDKVLTAAESLFNAMKDKQYPIIWTMITEKTKRKIIDSTYKELKKAGNRIEKDKIEADFQKGEEIARTYWEGYLLIFDPQIVLEESRWTIGMIRQDKAEINIQFKKSKYPAILKLFKENEKWKVGLHETFATRSLLQF